MAHSNVSAQSTAVPDLPAIEAAAFAWVAEVAGGTIVAKAKASGGNRRQSWAIDVETAIFRSAHPNPSASTRNCARS